MFGRNLSWIWLDKPWSVHRGITHDDRIYSEPYAFKPERYLDPSKPCLDPRNLVFGTGKRYGHRILLGVASHLSNHRSCVGRYLAENMIFIALVTLLFAFDISPEVDKNGKTIIPEVEYTGGAFMWVWIPIWSTKSCWVYACAAILIHSHVVSLPAGPR